MQGNPPEFEPRPITARDGRRATVRLATPDDADAFHAHAIELFRTSEHGVVQPDEAAPVERMREKLAQGDSARGWAIFIVLPEDAPGIIVGDAGLYPETKRKIAHNATLGIGLVPGWQRVGLGRALMEIAIDWARAHPALKRVELQVFANNDRAVALYGSLGFVREGLHPGRVIEADGRAIDEIRMALDVSA
ncbi:MAG: GNAT family protein [Phycisphaerales bacterium]